MISTTTTPAVYLIQTDSATLATEALLWMRRRHATTRPRGLACDGLTVREPRIRPPAAGRTARRTGCTDTASTPAVCSGGGFRGGWLSPPLPVLLCRRRLLRFGNRGRSPGPPVRVRVSRAAAGRLAVAGGPPQGRGSIRGRGEVPPNPPRSRPAKRGRSHAAAPRLFQPNANCPPTYDRGGVRHPPRPPGPRHTNAAASACNPRATQTCWSYNRREARTLCACSPFLFPPGQFQPCGIKSSGFCRQTR